MTDVLDELKAIVNADGDTYSSPEVIGVMRRAISEIESLRNQFFDGVTRILATAKETNSMVRDANDRLDRAGIP